MPSRLRYILILLALYWAGNLVFPFLRNGEAYLPRHLSSWLFLIVDLFYLPVAIGLSRKGRQAGWILISFFLVKKLVFAIVEIISEMVSPTEIYLHPDSFFPVSEGERKAEIWLMILLPLLVWTSMLFSMWRPAVKHYFDCSRSTGLRLLAYAAAGSLLYRLLLFVLYDV